MKPFTYHQLLEALKELDSESLDRSVSVFSTSVTEVYPVTEVTFVSEMPSEYREELEDILDYDHPVIVI